MDQSLKLVLPPRDYSGRRHGYGDLQVAANYIGLDRPRTFFAREWQHGWIQPQRNIHPEFVIGSDGRSYHRRGSHRFFVARDDQVHYLRAMGYRDVHAIGLPIVYLSKPNVERLKNSLLVMPVHSLPETAEDWSRDSAEYKDYLAEVVPQFETVYACVHPSCLEKGHWATDLESIGIRVVAGAHPADQNSLARMAYLLAQFEHLTTNDFGSHVAYGSFFGCKVSVAGPRPTWRRSFAVDEFYKNAPKVLDIVEEWYLENAIAKQFPEFLCEPGAARPQETWGAWQLGAQSKRSPGELKKLFGWRWEQVAIRKARSLSGNLLRALRKQ